MEAADDACVTCGDPVGEEEEEERQDRLPSAGVKSECEYAPIG